jgi:HD-GYP domain-containing protein (c-di-GMP phosphodiesterase class II)
MPWPHTLSQLGQFGLSLSQHMRHWWQQSVEVKALPTAYEKGSVELLTSPAAPRNPMLDAIAHIANMDQAWAFLTQWLTTPSMACLWLTVAEAQQLTLCHSEPQLAESICIPLRQPQTHLADCFATADTTFCGSVEALGHPLSQHMAHLPQVKYFSIPLPAAGRTQAIVTLGFYGVDRAAQQSISRVYTHKELLGQLISQCLWQAQLATLAQSHKTPMGTTTQGLLNALCVKDPYTSGHSMAVARYAGQLAQHVGLGAAECQTIQQAAQLHDIGKIGIPDAILQKPGPLNPEEWAIMRTHPQLGAERILQGLTHYTDCTPMVLHHHERWNGTGYPHKLAGQSIPLGARIVAITDAYHGLTSKRAYRSAMDKTEALALLQQDAGVLWDPDLMAEFTQLLKA